MNYEIITGRWRCQECGGPVRIHFSQSESVEDEFICDMVSCETGHQIMDEMAQEMMAVADEEFYAAMERGEQVAQVWKAPEQVQQDPT
jgi:hypothetical protein